jgi:hypothetical protein
MGNLDIIFYHNLFNNSSYTKQYSNPYGPRIQLCGTASNSNIELLQRFQSKTLQPILNAPWYINNHRIYENLRMNRALSKINSGIPNI